jgi:hypothetical protein
MPLIDGSAGLTQAVACRACSPKSLAWHFLRGFRAASRIVADRVQQITYRYEP